MRGQSRTLDQVIESIASRQHGVVARRQLLAAGVSIAAIDRRVQRGALLPIFRGVYRVGHRAPSVEATYMGAVLACGENALLCGRAAGHVLGLLKGAPPPPEVVVPAERRIEGVRTVRARGLDQRDVTRWRGIPTTTPARSLVDLAADLPADALARAFHEASVLHGTTPEQVEAVLARRPTARGARALRRVVHGDERVTLSALERRFLALLREHGLPLPETNRVASGRRVDCRWPEHRLTVELDSYRYHGSRHAWEQDRRRERDAYARGDDLRRYTWGDVFERPAALVRELRPLLRKRANQTSLCDV